MKGSVSQQSTVLLPSLVAIVAATVVSMCALCYGMWAASMAEILPVHHHSKACKLQQVPMSMLQAARKQFKVVMRLRPTIDCKLCRWIMSCSTYQQASVVPKGAPPQLMPICVLMAQCL